LAGGYLPLGAAILSERLWEPMMARHGALMTGHTFSGHTAACAAGVAVQTIVERDGLLDKVKTDGIYLMDLLRKTLGDRPYVGDIRGRGFFIGIELVADRASKEPFEPALQLFGRVRDRTFANGLICYPTGGNVDGVKGDQIILAPPYNASRAELEEIVDKLQRSLTEVITALPKKR
jgi:adenosylmethionine-8-amino-7-oxononanoate aminotransferase